MNWMENKSELIHHLWTLNFSKYKFYGYTPYYLREDDIIFVIFALIFYSNSLIL